MTEMTMGQLASKLTVASNQVEPTVKKKLATLAQVGVGYVKHAIQQVHAVDTGTMLNSTQAEQVTPSLWLIGPTVFYAPYVALGTSRMAARPFHLMAAKRLQKDAQGLFSAEDLGL